MRQLSQQANTRFGTTVSRCTSGATWKARGRVPRGLVGLSESVFRNCKLRMGPKPLGPGTDAPKRSFRGAYDGDALPPPLSDGPDRCPVAAPGAAAPAQYR